MKCLTTPLSSMFTILASVTAVVSILIVACNAHIFHVDHTGKEHVQIFDKPSSKFLQTADVRK